MNSAVRCMHPVTLNNERLNRNFEINSNPINFGVIRVI